MSDNKHMLTGLDDGSIYVTSWKGEVSRSRALGLFRCLSCQYSELLDLLYIISFIMLFACWFLFGKFCGALVLDEQLDGNRETREVPHHADNATNLGVLKSADHTSKRSAIMHLELSLSLRSLVVLFSDGRLLQCSVSKRGLKQADSIRSEKSFGPGDAVCISLASEQQILAVGTRKGFVELYDMTDSASLIRSVSLYDWGYVKIIFINATLSSWFYVEVIHPDRLFI